MSTFCILCIIYLKFHLADKNISIAVTYNIKYIVHSTASIQVIHVQPQIINMIVN